MWTSGLMMLERRAITLLIIVVILPPPCMAWATDDESCKTDGTTVASDEKKLYNCLMKNYVKDVRPAVKHTDVVNVTLDMVLLQIVSLDEKNRILDLNGWLHKSWIDPQLKWNPQDYGGLKTLRIPSEKIWLPDIILLNNAELSNSYVMDKLAVVNSEGEVHWVPHARFRSFCGLTMKKFPFDTQTCNVLFGSWTYDATQLDLLLPKTGNATQKYIWDGKEWDIILYQAYRKVYPYTLVQDSAKKYPYIAYKLKMKRVSLFYGTLLVAPVVLMAVLTMFVFLVPPEAGERITLAIGILISLSLQTLVIDDYLPTEIDEMPIIFMYILFDFIMVTWAILISIMVLNFHFRDIRKGKVPQWLRCLFLGSLLRKVLFLKAEPYNALPTGGTFSEVTEEFSYEHQGTELRNSSTLTKSPTMALEKVLEDIRTYLGDLAAKQQPTHRQLVLNEWHQTAMVVDRLSFVVYMIITILVTISICGHS